VIRYSGPCCPDLLVSLLVLSAGLFAAWSGWRQWRHPDSLAPGSCQYQLIQVRLRFWPWRWKESKPYPPLTDGQIRSSAAMTLAFGIVIVVLAISSMLVRALQSGSWLGR